MENPNYQILVKNKTGSILGEFSNWFQLKFSERHNNYGFATFQIPITSSELLNLVSLRRFEIVITRNGAPVWSGEQANRYVQILANNANLVTIECFTYFEQLNARYTEPYVRFDGVDQGEILKQLVEASQAKADGDFGFTFADIPATMNRDRDYQTYNIMQAFINMSNLINGIDFWIDHNKVIHIVPRRGLDKSKQFVFELGVNMLDPLIQDNFSSPGNRVIAMGAGFGTSQAMGEYIDTAARGRYLLREQVITDLDVSEVATLNSKAQSSVAKQKQLIQSLEFSQLPRTLPSFGSLAVGDSAGVILKEGSYDIKSPYRTYGYEVQIGDNGEEYVHYLIGK